ncbi:MAG: hypothetical protein QM755_23365 [Luteolibacter sp.]
MEPSLAVSVLDGIITSLFGLFFVVVPLIGQKADIQAALVIVVLFGIGTVICGIGGAIIGARKGIRFQQAKALHLRDRQEQIAKIYRAKMLQEFPDGGK